mmetsp:Transcript_9734/g.59136  ORF Transcript_9734/g.59136 Transcript_9734/m.59136 type:complete len:157 (+) Transcript_9734:1490-1960(+)
MMPRFILYSSVTLAIGLAAAWTSCCINLFPFLMVVGNDALHLSSRTARDRACQSDARGCARTSSHLFVLQTYNPISGNAASKHPLYKTFFVIRKSQARKKRPICQSKRAHGFFVPWSANDCAARPDEVVETIRCLGAYSFQGATNPSAMARALLRM